MRTLFLLLLCLVVITCKQGNIACQSPPPTLSFSLTKGDTPVTAASSTVTIAYTDKNGIKRCVSDLTARDTQFSTYELITTSRALDDPVFTVDVNQVASGTIQLKTYQDKSPCDGWVHQSELRFNGTVVTHNPQGEYPLSVN